MLRQRSYGSVKIISLDRDKALLRLQAIARRIYADHPEVKEVRLFGSLARGDQVGTSDIDVLIVLRHDEPGQMLERIRTFYPYFDLPVPVDVLAYTEAEIAERLQGGDPFMARVWEESYLLVPESGCLPEQ